MEYIDPKFFKFNLILNYTPRGFRFPQFSSEKSEIA